MSADLQIEADRVTESAAHPPPPQFRRRPNARRYILRLNEQGVPCVTIPRYGSLVEAHRFLERNAVWLERQMQKFRERKQAPLPEDKILFRGEWLAVVTGEAGSCCFGDQRILLKTGMAELRLRLKARLWRLAKLELPGRVDELALQHGLKVSRVSVRDQRSRWGSCSMRGVISLNWRLIQTPDFVRDYIIVHELMHLREMNHSARFWSLVRSAFPQMDAAEDWLKKNSALLRRL